MQPGSGAKELMGAGAALLVLPACSQLSQPWVNASAETSRKGNSLLRRCESNTCQAPMPPYPHRNRFAQHAFCSETSQRINKWGDWSCKLLHELSSPASVKSHKSIGSLQVFNFPKRPSSWWPVEPPSPALMKKKTHWRPRRRHLCWPFLPKRDKQKLVVNSLFSQVWCCKCIF